MKSCAEEILAAEQEFSVYHLENAKRHIENALRLEPENLVALELMATLALQIDFHEGKKHALHYLTLKQQLPLPVATMPRLIHSYQANTLPKVSMMLASRHQGNSQNWFENFLTSLQKHTSDLSKFELIVRIDEDDDSLFFQTLLEAVDQQVSWKIISGSRHYGFIDRATYIWEALDFAHPAAEYVLPLSDIAVFVVADWDVILQNYLSNSAKLMLNLTENKAFPGDESANEITWMLFRSYMQPSYYLINHSLMLLVKQAFAGARARCFNLDLIFSLLANLLDQQPTDLWRQMIRSESGTSSALMSTKDKQLWAMIDYYELLEDNFYQKCLDIAEKSQSQSRALPRLSELPKIVKRNLKNIKNNLQAFKFRQPLPKTAQEFFAKSDEYFSKGKLAAAMKYYQQGLNLHLSRNLADKTAKNFMPSVITEEFSRQEYQPLISLLMGCRLKNNTNSKLKSFLSSLLNTVEKLENIEVLMAIDHDDEIDKITTILTDFPTISVLPVIMARNRGYYDLHQKYAKLYEYIAPSSRAVMICSDDSYFSRNGWDKDLVENMQKYPDDLVFYNLFVDRDLIPVGQEHTYLWWLFQRNPATLYPAVGKGVIEAIRQSVPDGFGWTLFGNSLMVDSFFEMLRWHFYQVSGVNRTINIPNAIKRELDVASHPETTEKLQMRYRDGMMLYAGKLSANFQRQINQIAVMMKENLIS